jgi:hypothetical protein
LDENFSRLITTFDEVPLLFARARSTVAICTASAPAAFHDKGVDLKRRPPKSLPTASSVRGTASFEARFPTKDAARRDSAVHVSLSSDSLVKQPGTKAVPKPPVNRRAVEAQGFRFGIGSLVTDISEELQKRADAERRPASRVFRRGAPKCQPPQPGGKNPAGDAPPPQPCS